MTYSIQQLPQPGASIRAKAYAEQRFINRGYQHYLDWVISQKKQWLWSVGRESNSTISWSDGRDFDRWLARKYLTLKQINRSNNHV